jgi:hypothetical protein
MMPDLNPELTEFISAIGRRNIYSGNKIPESIMRQFEIEEDMSHIGILVPFWLSVLERGRGPRKSNKDHGLWRKIYAWMQKRNMFRSVTAKGKINEAKAMTWYINKYGNEQFRKKVYIDIYTSERAKLVDNIYEKFSAEIYKVTMDVL